MKGIERQCDHLKQEENNIKQEGNKCIKCEVKKALGEYKLKIKDKVN